jgi:hypothetical protein
VKLFTHRHIRETKTRLHNALEHTFSLGLSVKYTFFFLSFTIDTVMTSTIPVIQQPDNYVRGVSFDTMTDQDQPDYSFTLRGKTQGYQRTRRSRIFMVATDLANYSDYALDWVIEVMKIYSFLNINCKLKMQSRMSLTMETKSLFCVFSRSI